MDDRLKEKAQSQETPAKTAERRRFGLFAWIGPMLERRKPKVEPVDPSDFEDDRKK